MTTPDPRLASMATPMPADSHGAVDPSARTSTPTSTESVAPVTGEELHIPLIATIDEGNFQDIMSMFQAVPVIMVVWSPHSLESKSTLAMLKEIVRKQAGEFQPVEVDIDQAPAIAQTLRIRGVPTVVTLVGGRPAPLLQGTTPKGQMLSIITQVLDTATQMGVTARIVVVAEGTAVPTSPEHGAPLAAKAVGNPDEATTGWQKVIELNPRDEDAKSYLSRVQLVAHSTQVDVTDPAAHADALFATGDATGAFDVLLDLLVAPTDAEERDALRLHPLDLFRVADSSPEVFKAHTRLAILLT